MLVETVVSSSWPLLKNPRCLTIFIHFDLGFSPSEIQELKEVVTFWLCLGRIIIWLFFCSQYNLPIASLKPNGTAVSRQCRRTAVSRRGKEGVLSYKSELSFCAGTALWLEQSHPPRFFPFGEGPIQSPGVISLCHLLDCYLQCSNSRVQTHGWCWAITVWLLQYGQLRSYSGSVG